MPGREEDMFFSFDVGPVKIIEIMGINLDIGTVRITGIIDNRYSSLILDL